MTLNHLRITVIVFLAAFLAGCNESGPHLNVEKGTGDKVHETAPSPEVIQRINPSTMIVTGEAATTSDDRMPQADTAEDKTGAVAVKTEY